MHESEIGQVAKPWIDEWVADGFYPSMTELTGSYSEVDGLQVIFAKGKERRIVWLERNRSHYGHSRRILTLYVAYITLPAGETTLENSHYWAKDWKAKSYRLESVTLYGIESNFKSWYTTDKDEWDEMCRRQDERMDRRRTTNPHHRDIKVTTEWLKLARKFKGFKSIRRADLNIRRVNNAYSSNIDHSWRFINNRSGNSVCVQFPLR